MKKVELPYFEIGSSYGGNQDWFIDFWMYLGGCGALTNCDLMIYLALHKGMKRACTFDVHGEHGISKKEYKRFGMYMKPFIRPRHGGVKELHMYTEGALDYARSRGMHGISMTGLQGTEAYEKAEEAIRDHIDRGIPVPYLMLHHKDKEFDFFVWHWFLVNGYREDEDGTFYIKTATYGKAYWLPLKRLWDTGFEEKGGIILVDFDKE